MKQDIVTVEVNTVNLKELEKLTILTVVSLFPEKTKKQIAGALGISPRTLSKKLKQYRS